MNINSHQVILPILIALAVNNSLYAEQGAGVEDGVFYQIYVRAFYDSDGDGLGDLQGVIKRLDYLEDLGIRGIWLMPLFRAPTDHKYFSSNYYLVDPEYGTNDDLRQLVREAHQRGMRVIIDFMVNHTSVKHPWFHASRRAFVQQEAGRQPSRRPKYLDYYHWAKGGDIRIRTPETYDLAGKLDESRMKNWKEAKNIFGEPVGKYYSRFVDAPDLNYANSEVREEIKRIGKFWLVEVGVDGFRLDAARHIFDCENAKVLEPADRNFLWWKEFCDEMKTVKPDCLLTGEIWSNHQVMASYLQTGMDSVYDFALSDAIRGSVKAGKDRGVVKAVLEMDRLCGVHSDEFVASTFLSNHDFPRLMTMLKDDESSVRLAASILFTLPGRPGFYYGDELGLRCDQKIKWLSMPWDEEGKDPGQTAWMVTDKQFTDGIRTVVDQSRDETSLYWHFKRLIHLRNKYPALSSGELTDADVAAPEIVAFFRTKGGESMLVVHNLAAEVTTIEPTGMLADYGNLIYASHDGVKSDGSQLRLPARGTVLLQR